MRVFAAVPLPPPAVHAISDIEQKLRQRLPGVRWVSPNALHLTLHFFGEVAEGPLGELYRVFEDPGLRRAAMPARLGTLGQFPPRGNPRVLWIGLLVEGDELRSYWESFEKAVAPLGWEPDRRGFAPHVTIARNGGAFVEEEWIAGAEVSSLRFSLSECVLFQSVLRREGAEYVPLRRIPFHGGSE